VDDTENDLLNAHLLLVVVSLARNCKKNHSRSLIILYSMRTFEALFLTYISSLLTVRTEFYMFIVLRDFKIVLFYVNSNSVSL